MDRSTLLAVILGGATTLVLLAALTWAGLPEAVRLVGLHPHYDIPASDLRGRRVEATHTAAR